MNVLTTKRLYVWLRTLGVPPTTRGSQMDIQSPSGVTIVLRGPRPRKYFSVTTNTLGFTRFAFWSCSNRLSTENRFPSPCLSFETTGKYLPYTSTLTVANVAYFHVLHCWHNDYSSFNSETPCLRVICSAARSRTRIFLSTDDSVNLNIRSRKDVEWQSSSSHGKRRYCIILYFGSVLYRCLGCCDPKRIVGSGWCLGILLLKLPHSSFLMPKLWGSNDPFLRE